MAQEQVIAPAHRFKLGVIRVVSVLTFGGWLWLLSVYVPTMRTQYAQGYGSLAITLVFILLPLCFCGVSIMAFRLAGRPHHGLAGLLAFLSAAALLLGFFITEAIKAM